MLATKVTFARGNAYSSMKVIDYSSLESIKRKTRRAIPRWVCQITSSGHKPGLRLV